MIYDFYVLTILGMKNATVTTDSDFDTTYNFRQRPDSEFGKNGPNENHKCH
jgi:hypothetical protein